MFDKIFFFNTMITPKLITFLYWVMLIGTVTGSLTLALSGNIFYSIFALIIGFVLTRVWCELLIVLFKINENIQKLANQKNDGGTDLFA